MPESFKDNIAYCEAARGVCVHRVSAIQQADMLSQEIERREGGSKLGSRLSRILGLTDVNAEIIAELRNELAGQEALAVLICNRPGMCTVEQAKQASSFQNQLKGVTPSKIL